MRTVSLAALVVAACGSTPAPPNPPQRPAPPDAAPVAEPGRVPETPRPELRLPTDLTPTAYTARLEVDPAKPDFHGDIEIEATLARAASVLWLNADELAIETADAWVGEVAIPLEATVDGGLLALRPAQDLPAGPLRLVLSYTGRVRDESLGLFAQSIDGAPYLLTQFESIYARRVFPCFDEPSSKVPWTLTLDIPSDQIALGNMPVATEEDLGGGRHRVHFEPTPPLPSYLVAFAVGRFEMVDGGTSPGGTPVRIAAFHGRTAEAAYAAKNTAAVLGLLEDYFATPFPYPKLDIVPIPRADTFGAMENVGMITCDQRYMLFPADAAPTQLHFYDWAMAHEIAHQWFGDLVTLAWWDDIWLNEAFATWMEAKVMVQRPGWAEGGETAPRGNGLWSDSLATARRVRQPIEHTDEIFTAFDGITYQKGAAVIRMFEQWVGEDDFRAGVRAYLAAHAHGTATATDFLAAIDDATTLDITASFSTFLDQAGAPLVTAALACDGARSTVTLRQSRFTPPGAASTGEHPVWSIPVCIAYGTKGSRAHICTTLDQESETVELPSCPTWFLPNANASGYYRMSIAPDAFAALVGAGWKQLTPAERQLVTGDGRTMLDAGTLELGALLDLVPRLAKGGRTELGDAVGLAWLGEGVVSDEQRPAYRAWIRKTFGARARKLGWLPKKKDDIATTEARAQLTTIVAMVGRDPKLLASARKLARTWKTLPETVRGPVLGAAVIEDPAFARKLLGELGGITDQRLHDAVVGGLGWTQDPEVVTLAMSRLLDPANDILLEVGFLWSFGQRAVAATSAAFVREHVDELVARLPGEMQRAVVWPVVGTCEAATREDAAAWAEEHVTPLQGGQRQVAQAVESLDQCIARRATLGPQVDAWMAAHGGKSK